jgi:hypothetical protein
MPGVQQPLDDMPPHKLCSAKNKDLHRETRFGSQQLDYCRASACRRGTQDRKPEALRLLSFRVFRGSPARNPAASYEGSMTCAAPAREPSLHKQKTGKGRSKGRTMRVSTLLYLALLLNGYWTYVDGRSRSPASFQNRVGRRRLRSERMATA